VSHIILGSSVGIFSSQLVKIITRNPMIINKLKGLDWFLGFINSGFIDF
jgi:hypothetical protein